MRQNSYKQIEEKMSTICISEITCEPPYVPKNGAARIKKQSHFGTIVTFTCDPGYILEGSRSIRCQADESWNGTEPTCKGNLIALIAPYYGFNNDILSDFRFKK